MLLAGSVIVTSSRKRDEEVIMNCTKAFQLLSLCLVLSCFAGVGSAQNSVQSWGVFVTALPEDLRDLVAVSAGAQYSLGLKRNGSVVAWGDNYAGECTVPEPNTGIAAISAGVDHVLALRHDGSIVGWGANA